MSSVNEQLRILVALQKIEIKIDGNEKALASTDDRVNALNAELSEYQAKVTDQQQRLDDLKKSYRSNEDENQMIEIQITKSKEKLGAVKTNKEYQSMLKEIDELKVKSSMLEDKMLQELDHIESSEKTLVEHNADLDDVATEVEQKQEEIRNRAERKRTELGLLRQKRDEIWNTIDSKIQSVYRNVKRQGHGIALAAIEEEICQACRMNIPPQLFNELLRMNNLLMCPNCQRIMYPKIAI